MGGLFIIFNPGQLENNSKTKIVVLFLMIVISLECDDLFDVFLAALVKRAQQGTTLKLPRISP